jgi:sortase A
VGGLRTRRWARMLLTTASVGLLVAAVATIGYPFYTNLVQDRYQARLDRQFASDELRQAYLDKNVAVGDSLTRILIPAIEVDVVVVEGTTASALRAGAGHYPETPLPCEIGNVSIAGHRTTYGRPFHNVDQLEVGDEITLETPIGTCTYEVSQAPFPVSPFALEVVANTPEEAVLTLTTCHPKGSARERLIVKATLVRSDVEPPAEEPS